MHKPASVPVCVMGAVGAIIHLREEGTAFPFCRVCVPRPLGGRWRSWDVNLGPQGGGGCLTVDPAVQESPGPTHLGLHEGLSVSWLSAAKCSLPLRPPSWGEASPPLPMLVTHPVHQQLACAPGWLGTSLLEATGLGLHGGAWWDHHPASWE
uniref:Uncharacterized protein n=1 Tax=Cebus imitator TaxID=2715852 RepID=A0A2K5QJ23_CEBIM